MYNTTNSDGSPTQVYCPAYQENQEVSNWFDYYYYSAFNGDNYDFANGYAMTKTGQ